VALGGTFLGVVVAILLLRLVDSTATTQAGGTSPTQGSGLGPEVLIWVVLIVVLVGRGTIAYLTTRFRVGPGELRVDSGLLQRQSKRVRLDRVQSVDVLTPLAARVLGLAEVRVATAGTESSSVRLRFLSRHQAQALRAELLGLAHGIGPGAPEAPERPLAVVSGGTLVAAVVLGTIRWRLFLLLVWPTLALVLLFQGKAKHQGAAGAVVGFGVLVVIIVLHTMYREITTLWGFTVAESPDGVRIRHGLFSTSAQTVPFARMQAVRVRQPLLWRPFGWASVRVNVAGYAGGRQGRNTVLLPAGPKPFAEWLAGRVLGGLDVNAVPLTPPPARARFRAPVWWRYAGVGSDERIFVARHGVLHRSLAVVPHGRTQSVRLRAGPWQRALGLATVHLDSTRGPVRIRGPFRDQAEARAIVDREAERARQARLGGG
jgi:putative membrane protein